MKNKILKFFVIIMIFLSIVTFFNINSYCAQNATGEEAVGAFMGNVDDYQKNGETVPVVQTFMGAIRNVFHIVSMTVAIVMLLILGVKYMSSSVEEKAEIKKHAVTYVVGAILIFATNGIIAIIAAFASIIG